LSNASSPIAEHNNKAFALRQKEFLESLVEIFSKEFREHWVPVFAEIFYRETRNSSEEKKTDDMRQMLDALSGWLDELRIRLLRDLARFAQMNQDALCGGVKDWMKRSLDELWNSSVTEEQYREWFASACDDTGDLEIWRAPLWLARALKIPEKDICLEEERPYQEKDGYIICNDEEMLSDCQRLDSEHTDDLIHEVWFLRKLTLSFSAKEDQEIVQLHLSISQGAKIPTGLHDNAEESLAQILARHLPSFSGRVQGAKRKRRKMPHGVSEREAEIRSIIRSGVKGLHYCREMDAAGVKIPLRWLAEGCPGTYVAAYMKGDPWRHRIVTEKWQIQKSMTKNQKDQ
jgi:hypothetical protein